MLKKHLQPKHTVPSRLLYVLASTRLNPVEEKIQRALKNAYLFFWTISYRLSIANTVFAFIRVSMNTPSCWINTLKKGRSMRWNTRTVNRNSGENLSRGTSRIVKLTIGNWIDKNILIYFSSTSRRTSGNRKLTRWRGNWSSISNYNILCDLILLRNCNRIISYA